MQKLMNGTDADLQASLDAIKTSIHTAAFLDTLLDSLDATLDSLIFGLSNLFKFTDNSTTAFVTGQTAIDRLFGDMYGMNTNLGTLATIIGALSASTKTALGVDSISIPSSVSSSLGDPVLSAVVDLFTVAVRPGFYKFMCQFKNTGLIDSLGMTQITDLLLPFTADCSATDPRV